MALNFVVSYTFSPSTTISSSQVNTNTSDVAAVFQGLEAVTKSFARLQVDATPTVAADVVRKDYVDHYSAWRRPVLQYASATTVAVESGLDGTSGDIPIVFPDGSIRTETSTTRTTFNITRNAVLTTSGAQSGLTGATSEANNTWYALYAVKVTDSSTLWVTVGSTVLPLRANYATLNTAYGTNGWVYLGLIRNGDNSGTIGDILSFTQSGNFTMFRNDCVTNSEVAAGTLLATTSGSTSLTWSYAAGTGAAQVPANISNGVIVGSEAARVAAVYIMAKPSGGYRLVSWQGGAFFTRVMVSTSIVDGIVIANNAAATSDAADILLGGFVDGVLGVGSNPLL